MEINDYVRTKDGYIGQVESINEKDMCGEYPRPSVWLSKCFVNLFIDEIKKHSKDIIDLIEVGDYVNGMMVTGISGTRWDDKDLHCYCDNNHSNDIRHKNIMISSKDIKSILTKEQYIQNAYTIE